MARRNKKNPIEEILWPTHVSARCGAHARSTGQPCRRWACVGSRRCRLHGGAKGSGRPAVHDRYSAKAKRERTFLRLARYLLREQEKAARQQRAQIRRGAGKP